MTVLVCDCNGERACSYHAHDLYVRPEEENHDAERQSFVKASSDFYIPGWTPDCEDEREWDRAIIGGWNEGGDLPTNNFIACLA